jgi:hypothetical protein
MNHKISVVLISFLPAIPLFADEKPLAPSPDGKIEAIVQFEGDPSLQEYEVVFRIKNSKKKIGSFSLGGYSNYAQILWSPDGLYAALQTHLTRHTKEMFVFQVTETGMQQVKIQDYLQNICGRLGVLHGGRGFVDEPLKWLDKDRLLFSAKGTLAMDSSPGDTYKYEVEIRIIPDGDSLVGWLEKITPVKSNE